MLPAAVVLIAVYNQHYPLWLQAIADQVGMPTLFEDPINITNFQSQNGSFVTFDFEEIEHSLVRRFVSPDATVLEVGVRYGTTSCVLDRRLRNSGKQVAVECDDLVWPALERNLKSNNCGAKLEKSMITNKVFKKSKTRWGGEYTTYFVEDGPGKEVTGEPVPTISFDALQSKYGYKFDTFLIDCEGCFYHMLKEFPDMVDDVKMIILEADYGIGWQPEGHADYDWVVRHLEGKGFTMIHDHVAKGFRPKTWADRGPHHVAVNTMMMFVFKKL